MVKSLLILNGNAYAGAVERNLADAVLAYDLHWLGADGRASLARAFVPAEAFAVEKKSLLYFDRWGTPYYSLSELPHAGWQPGPGDLTPWLPRTRSPKGPYPYRIDKFWRLTFPGLLFNAASSPENAHVLGFALDDWTGDVDWWNLSPAERRVYWPDWKPGGDWNQAQLEEEESYARALCALRGKIAMVNGRGRRLGSRLFESFGVWESPETVKLARPGDGIIVRGILGDRKSWGATTAPKEVGGFPVGTSFRDVFRIALKLAIEKDLYLGLGMLERPLDNPSGSAYGVHEYLDPRKWEAI